MLEVVEVTEDRCQVIDERGRFVVGTNSRAEAEAFVAGYKLGREDGAMVHAHAVDGLDRRIAGASR